MVAWRKTCIRYPGMQGVAELENMREAFGPDEALERLTLLRRFGRRRCKSVSELLSLHETLCFCRAFPDNEAVLAIVEKLLTRWHRRSDVRALSSGLGGQGIAGVGIEFAFYWPTAQWLARNWPRQLRLDWDTMEDPDCLEPLLPLLMPPAEGPGFEELDLSARQWIRRLRQADEADGTFVVRRFAEAKMDERWRERIFDKLDLPFVLTTSETAPSRTTAFIPGLPRSWQNAARTKHRPELRAEIARPPKSIRQVSAARGHVFVEAARTAMLTRERDLEQIAYADPRDAWLIDDGDGLCFIALGMLPERRFILEGTYVYLVVQNGVPIGYLQGSGLGGWVEVNFNIFPPFRGRGAATLYARSLAAIHAFQRSTTFVVEPYQLGDGNEEALASGAWWFYFKLGFVPQDEAARAAAGEVRALAARELKRATNKAGYKSSRATLRKLSSVRMQLACGPPPRFPYGGVGRVGLHTSKALTDRGGGHREEALRRAADEAALLLDDGGDPRESMNHGERHAFSNWSGIVLSLMKEGKWNARDRRSLLTVIRARGGKTEHEYIVALAQAPRVLEGLGNLAQRVGEATQGNVLATGQ